MAISLVLLIVLALVVVSVAGAVVRHEGDLFAWSRHPVTRIVFGIVGLFLVALVVVPEIVVALSGIKEPGSVQITVPVASLDERFPLSEPDSRGRRDDMEWSGGTLIANWLYVDGHGRVVTNDSAVLEWNGSEPLVLKGERVLAGCSITYKVRIEKLSLSESQGLRFVELEGDNRVTIKRGGGRSSSSGGLGRAAAGEIFTFHGRIDADRAGGLQLRRKGEQRGLARMVLLIHPLDQPDAPTQGVDATTYLAPHLDQVLENRGDAAAIASSHVYRFMARTPPFFGFVGHAGPGALVLVAGMLLLAFTVPSRRGIYTLVALLLTSLTLVGVDRFATERALAQAADLELTAAQRADAIACAAATYFHSGRVVESARILLDDETLGPDAKATAWRAIVGNELQLHYKQHSAGMTQLVSGYDHGTSKTWYSLWTLNPTDGPRSHLVIIPDAHGDHFGMVWMRAALAAADVPPGIVVVRSIGVRTAPDMFVHIAPPEQIPEILRVAGDQGSFLKTALWQELVAPVFAP